jgi:hypothetical protein
MSQDIEKIEINRVQWIKGDKIGNIETIIGTDKEWTLFQSGSRISSTLLNEFMIPVNGDDALDFNSAPSETVSLQPTRNTNRATLNVSKATGTNPIRMLFDKQKNSTKVKLSLSLDIIIPKEDLFNIMICSFEEAEVMKELCSFISDQVKDDEVKESIKESIQALITERYKPFKQTKTK